MTKEQIKQLEADLWKSADTLRANSDLKSTEYSTPVLGLIFLKFADNKYSHYEQEILKEYDKLKGTRREKKISEIAVEKCGFYLPDHARYDHLLNLPVEKVSWYDAVKFCNKKSERDGLTPCYSGSGSNVSCNFSANGYRLLTEAEWEYAARGGPESRGYKYSGSSNPDEVAWYRDNLGIKTHQVGIKKANELGLYDMSGNVYEWCWDMYDDGYYRNSPTSNPKGPSSGKYRVLRGGSWSDDTRYMRCADRVRCDPDLRFNDDGFRYARTF